MKKVRIFKNDRVSYLEENINYFIKAHPNVNIVDIKFNSNVYGSGPYLEHYNAMIIYEEGD